MRVIDIYLKDKNGAYIYEWSTTWNKTCKEAKRKYLASHSWLDESQVKARFSTRLK